MQLRMMSQQHSLRYQCITRLESIVCELSIKEINCPDTVPYTWLRQQILLVPPNLVNEVVARMLFAIDQRPFDRYHYKEFPEQYSYLDKMIPTILHPDVTELIVYPDHVSKRTIIWMWNYVIPFLCKYLYTLRKLKVIHLPACRTEMLPPIKWGYVPEQEELTSHFNCTDELAECIMRSSDHLKRLDLEYSSFVNDETINSMLILPHLQHLNISRTNVTQKGLNKLANSVILEQLKFLSISSESFESFLENSARMTQLLGFSLTSQNFPQIQQMLKSLGKQLIYLSLSHANSSLVNVIREHCTTLKTLYIHNVEDDIYILKEPGFLSVKEITLVTTQGIETVKYILNHCINVESIELVTICEGDNRLIHQVLEKNRMLYLKKLHWVQRSCNEETATEIMKLIPSLLDFSWKFK